MMRPKSKIRRTHYVDLNKSVWKHFKDCQAAGIQINGKMLKDQAMQYARDMGLESFRGSEGWLDAFKRRHRIDLKTMTGYPVCYENDMLDEVDKECRELDMEAQIHHQSTHQQGGFFTNGNSAPEEFASSFFSTFAQQILPPPPPEPIATKSSLQNMINSMMTSSASTMPSTSAFMIPNQNLNPNQIDDHLVMKSCQIRVADKDISHALDTLRTYIMRNDPGAMNLLLPLQERLATTAGIGTDLSLAPSSSN